MSCKTFSLHLYNVGSTSTTSVRHCTNVMQIFSVYWEVNDPLETARAQRWAHLWPATDVLCVCESRCENATAINPRVWIGSAGPVSWTKALPDPLLSAPSNVKGCWCSFIAHRKNAAREFFVVMYNTIKKGSRYNRNILLLFHISTYRERLHFHVYVIEYFHVYVIEYVKIATTR